MRCILLLTLAVVVLAGCSKERGGRVEIYLLKSYTVQVDTTVVPATHSFAAAVLEEQPLVADRDIRYYKTSTTTFKLSRDIKPIVERYGPDKAFAVTVDGEPVYYGRFQPAYMSSVVYGIVTIEPMLMENNELTMHYVTWDGSAALQQLDHRNDARIIRALWPSGRIR